MKKLERRLDLGAVVAIAISAMLGSGIFVLPGIGFQMTGPSLWIAYLLSATCILPAALSKSELATAMPTSGGTYVNLDRTFGPIMGLTAGLGLWASLLLKSSFALIGFGTYLSVFTDTPILPIALGVLLFLTLINVLGVGKVSGILIGIISITLVALIGVSGLAIFEFDMNNFNNLFTAEMDGLIGATGLVFVSFAGVTKIAAIAEEIKDPEKNLPGGILVSLVLITIIYCTVTAFMAGTVPMNELVGNLKPVHTMAQYVGGDTFATIIAIIAVLAMSSMTNSGILAASRFPFAMSRDRLLPGALGKIHRSFLTPVWSIIISGSIIGIVILTMDITKIVKLASAIMIINFVMVNVSVIALREFRVQWYKPTYKSPLYPDIQIFGIISSLLLLSQMGLLALYGIVWTAIPALIIYGLYSRKRVDRKGVIGIRGKRIDIKAESTQVRNLKTWANETMDLSADASVVVPLFGKERSPEMLIEMGIALAENSNLEVVHLTEIPEQTDIDDVFEEPAHLRSLRRRVLAMASDRDNSVCFDPVVTHDVTRTIFRISQRLQCQWLIVEWGGKGRGNFTLNNPIGWLRNHLPCSLAIFRDAGIRYIRKILVLLNKDKNDGLVLKTADHLAQVHKADITICEWVGPDATDAQVEIERALLEGYCAQLRTQSYVEILRDGKRKLDSMLTATVDYDLFICAAQPYSLLNKVTGSFEDKLTSRSACSVLSVLSYVPDSKNLFGISTED